MKMNLQRGIAIVALIMAASLTTSPLLAQNSNWLGGTSDWSTGSNWNPTGVPSATGTSTATFKTTGSTSVTFGTSESVGTIKFIAGAQAYTFSVGGSNNSLTLLGNGINDNSTTPYTQIFNVGAGSLIFQNGAGAGDVVINNNLNGQTLFKNTSSAQTAMITDNPGGTTFFQDTATAGNSTINSAGSEVVFNDSSTAGHATLNDGFDVNIGGASFTGTSTAAHATIVNTGGYSAFMDNSNAGNANITNTLDGASHQGVTDFYGSSDAKNANILNENGSVTYFYDTSTADAATIINQTGGYTFAEDSASAGTSVIRNDGGLTYFINTSTSGSATITNTNLGSLQYGDSATAGTAIISNKDSSVSFSTNSSADQAQITNKAKGSTYFNNSSTAGTSTITNQNKGATYFSGTSSGGTARIINQAGGTLDISGLTSKGTQVGTIEGAGAVNLGSKKLTIVGLADNTSPVFSGIIADGGVSGGKKGSLTLDSSGSLTLAGSNTYTGKTTLADGTLIAANSQAFGMGNVRVKNGILETDDTNHVITVGKNYKQSGGTLLLNLNDVPGSASNDIVNVNGTAKLDGSLSINFTGAIMPKEVLTYTVVATTGGITDAGAGFTSPTFEAGAVAVTVTGTIEGDDFDVILSGIQNPFGTLIGTNLTPNQQRVADYFDRFDVTISSGPVIPLIQALDAISANPSALGPALDQLTPLRFGNFASTTAFNNAAFFNQQFDSYLAGHRGADGSFVSSNGGIDYSGLVMNDPNTDSSLQSVRSRLLAWSPAANTGLISDSGDMVTGGVDMKDMKDIASPGSNNPWNVFISGNVILAQDFSNATAGLAGANTTTGAVQVGADYKLTPHWLVGAMFGYGHTDATLDTIGSNASVDTYSPAVYASYSENGWYANGLASYGFANYSQTRQVDIGAFGGSANSSPGGDQIIGNLDGGYDFHRKGWTFGPTAGLGYTHLDVDGYTETGLPGADLNVSAQHVDSLRSRLGWGVRYAFQDANLTFTPHFNASWQHEYLNQSRGITSQFSSVAAGSFVVNTANPSRDSVIFDTGVDIQINDSLTAFVDYAAQAGQSNYFGQSVQAGVKIGF